MQYSFDTLYTLFENEQKKILLDIYDENSSAISLMDIPTESIKDKKPSEVFALYFSDYPAEELWRLFIDGEKQKTEYGWLDYEQREPGFMKAMFNAFLKMKEQIDEPLSLGMICELHAICSTNVANLNITTKPGYMRDNIPVGFKLIPAKNASTLGVIELMMKPVLRYGLSRSNTQNVLKLHAYKASRDEIEQLITSIITRYNEQISKVTDDIKKIKGIIKLIALLERSHPFNDANCRLFCILILMRELIRNGLSPVILKDPNRFDAYSENELFNEICQGMKIFNDVKLGNIQSLGLSTEDILARITAEKSSYQALLKTYQELKEIEQTYSFLKQSLKPKPKRP